MREAERPDKQVKTGEKFVLGLGRLDSFIQRGYTPSSFRLRDAEYPLCFSEGLAHQLRRANKRLFWGMTSN
jgi:hypothetical protein